MIQRKLKPACAYGRRSTDDQAGSLSAQREALIAFAEREGYRIVEWFEDDGISGTTSKRDDFQAMCQRARSGAPWQYILVWDRSRFFRPEDAREGLLYTYELEKAAGVVIVPINGTKRTGDSFIDAMIDLLEFNQAGQESVRKSRDVLRGQRQSAQAGTIPNGKVPYAFDALYVSVAGRSAKRIRYLADGSKELRSRDGKAVLEIWPREVKVRKGEDERLTLVAGDSDKVEVVREIFSSYVAGLSTRVIAHKLNEQGIPSPKGGQWRRNSVGRVIANPAYKGALAWNRQTWSRFHQAKGNGQIERISNPTKRWKENDPSEWVLLEEQWEALVDPAVWEKANARYRSTKPKDKSLTGSGHASRYLASGLIRCSCGSPLVGSDSYYRCSGRRDKGKTFCDSRSVKSEIIDNYLQRRIRDLFFTKDGEQSVMKEIEAQLDAMVSYEEHQQGPTAQEQIEDIEKQVQRIVKRIGSGLIEDDEAETILSTLRSRKQQLGDSGGGNGQSVKTLAHRRSAILKQCRQQLRLSAEMMSTAPPIIRKNIIRGFVASLELNTEESTVQANFLPLAPLSEAVTQSTTSASCANRRRQQ